jgi:hypothetical protein
VPGGRAARGAGAPPAAVRPPLPPRLRRHVAPLARHVPAVPLRPPRAAQPRREKRGGAAGLARSHDHDVIIMTAAAAPACLL